MQKTDYDIWRYSPVGKWFFDTMLTEEISLHEHALGGGSVLSDEPYKTSIRYAEAVGIIAGIELTCALDPFKEERNEAESNRQTSPD